MKIYVAFYKAFQTNADIIDRLIALWTLGNYSHTEIIIPEKDGFYMYSSSPRDGKVRRKRHRWNKNSWDYIEIDVTEKQIELIKEFFKKINHKSYDWQGIFGFVSPIRDNENKWFCSETSSNALKIIGDDRLIDKKTGKISPNRLKRILENDDLKVTFFKRLFNLIKNFKLLLKGE